EGKEIAPGQLRYAVGKARDAADAVRVAVDQDHPGMMPVRQLRRRLNGTFKPWKGGEPARAELPPDPEADHVTDEAPEPAYDDQCTDAQRARRRGIAREHRKQQAVRGRVAEHDGVCRVAMLADEVEERREISRKHQIRSPLRLPSLDARGSPRACYHRGPRKP